VTLNLISSVALPCLLFAVEAQPLTKAVIKVLEHPWSRVFMKLFWTFNNEIIAQCQFYTGFTTVEHLQGTVVPMVPLTSLGGAVVRRSLTK